MTLTVECKRLPTAERGSSNQNQQRNYTKVFRIKQTDTGSRAGVKSLITAAQAVMSGDPIPVYGDEYTDAGDTDEDSYAMDFGWEWPHPADKPKVLDVTVGFQPLQGGNTHGRLIEPDPLSWPIEYWIEWTEEQVVLQEATNVEELTSIGRSALTLGKVVNACGVEFSEPLMRTVYYPVIHAQKAYESLADITALDLAFQNTTNSDTFFGAALRKAKYLGTESGKVQKINGTSLYMGITRVWIKDATWDRKVLNNGWNHFQLNAAKSAILNDVDGKPGLFPNRVQDDADTFESDSSTEPSVASTEPLNLGLTGLLLAPGTDPTYVTYRDLNEVAYSGLGIGGS